MPYHLKQGEFRIFGGWGARLLWVDSIARAPPLGMSIETVKLFNQNVLSIKLQICLKLAATICNV